jgi:hypothetical protein
LIDLNWQVEINEEDEKALAAFVSKDNSSQRTLGDIILQKIREKDAEVSAGKCTLCRFLDTWNGSPLSKLIAILN